jgi:hypothetical protein
MIANVEQNLSDDSTFWDIKLCALMEDGLCGLVVRVLGYIYIRRHGFDSRHYQKKKVMGLERGALSLVSTTEELLDTKVAAPV